MYKMSSLDSVSDINQHFQDAIDVIQRHSGHPFDETEFKCYETLVNQQSSPLRHNIIYPVTHPSDAYWYETACYMDVNHLTHVVPDVSLGPSVSVDSPQFYLPPQRTGKGRKKLRLYEYLHEALHDTSMVDSIQWTDRCSGTFHFISKNKEKLAECWGQRKGNRKTMTYQKMARALRNYSRTGEIVKVRRKLTYQFNPAILQKLGTAHFPGHLSGHPGREVHSHHHHQHMVSPDQVYYHGPVAPDWHGGFGHFPLQADGDLGTGFMSSSEAKV